MATVSHEAYLTEESEIADVSRLISSISIFISLFMLCVLLTYTQSCSYMIAINNIKATHTIKVIDKAYGQNVNTLSVIALSCQQKQHVDRLSFLTVLLSLSFCDIKLLTIMWLRKKSPLLFMPPVWWPISVELSVSQSVCQSVRPSENFNGHNFFNIEHSNLIFGIHVHLMELHIFSCER